MSSLEALLYGLVQGLTEYLPVSSSAHLILLPRFLGTEDPGLAFDVFLHFGTLMATLIYFKNDWLELLRSWRAREQIPGPQATQSLGAVTLFKVIVATIPALVLGATFHKLIESSLRGNSVLVVTLPLGGIALWAIDRWAPQRRDLSALTTRDALWVGTLQCLALIPGMSRSGSTLIASRWIGLNRPASARFSFLISAPVTAAALVFEARKLLHVSEQAGMSVLALVLGAGSAFVFGWLAISGLLNWVKRHGYLGFAIYRVILAAVILLALPV